eukprot:3344851-Rhodomonas_salina.1
MWWMRSRTRGGRPARLARTTSRSPPDSTAPARSLRHTSLLISLAASHTHLCSKAKADIPDTTDAGTNTKGARERRAPGERSGRLWQARPSATRRWALGGQQRRSGPVPSTRCVSPVPAEHICGHRAEMLHSSTSCPAARRSGRPLRSVPGRPRSVS